MLKKYADIIIDISHEEVDKVFQYRIPDKLTDLISVGSPVKIPFGRGNHVRLGYVIGITDKTNYDEDKIKEIVDIDKDGVAISSKLIKLAAWIKENYGSTMINALRTVMPVKKSVKPVTLKDVVLNIDKETAKNHLLEYKRKNAKAKFRLVSELIDTDKLPKNVVTDKLNISPQTLNALVVEGVISIESKAVYRSVTNNSIGNTVDITLNNEQLSIINEFAGDIDNGIKKTYLLHGITGSGKTEIYIRAIKKVVCEGKQAIVLIPEIALTYQTVKYFTRYFGDRVTVINSKLSDGEKYDQMLRAKNGEVDVVIGPRSALFTPFERLGLIIIDEEHETSYKSDYPPKYHAREVACKRAELDGASVILGSATPSLESYRRAVLGEYTLWKLDKRAKNNSLATCSIVDMRNELRSGNRSIISKELACDINDRLNKHEQIMLFINKRGFNSCISCRSCGEVIKCPHCDVSLTKHNNRKLICHYCGYHINEPDKCPSCSSRFIGGYGTGTQKVEEEIKNMFPGARTLRMDKDTTSKKNSHEHILSSFGNGEADILIGTQMIVKGHDFPRVSLVGIVLADLTLFENDYRAGERTFDLLTQAAGRAGRGDISGKVVIQTYQPDNYAIKAAANQNYEEYYSCESSYRMIMHYPPMGNMLVVLMVSKDEALLDETANRLALQINDKYTSDKKLVVIGPAVPVLSRIKDIYRRVIYLKSAYYNKLIEVKDYIELLDICDMTNDEVNLQFDFNPMNMY